MTNSNSSRSVPHLSQSRASQRESNSSKAFSQDASSGIVVSTAGKASNTNVEQRTNGGVVAVDHRFRQSDFNRERYKMMFYLLMYFSLGFRFLFISIPFLFYTFLGPVALLTVSVVLVTYMYFYDYKT